MRYPLNTISPPKNLLRWKTRKDGTGRSMQNKRVKTTVRRKIANKSRRIM